MMKKKIIKRRNPQEKQTPTHETLFPYPKTVNIPISKEPSEKKREMLSRAFTQKPRRKPRDGENSNDSSRSGSLYSEYEDILVGFSDDLPLVSCGGSIKPQLRLRQVLQASVGVMGESRLGMTEKVVMAEGKMYSVKRFRMVCVGRRKFGRRVERLSQVSRKCEFLVPVTAYLYSKRIKLVVSDYYAMGSLADLLAGGREHHHTALDWNQRLTIALTMARAIAFIHSQCPHYERKLLMNTHGNIKASNVLIDVDFTARLSDYGYTQLAELVELFDTGQEKSSPSPRSPYCNKLCKSSDIYNFGVILLDMLGGSEAPDSRHCIVERKDKIREGKVGFFEFFTEGEERKQALQVLDVALACTDNLPDTRPSIEQILGLLEHIV